MPSSQAAATERRNDRIVTHEPPKLKTTLKTPPKQATNPLQFVKVGPCSLYRTAQEQLQKVQEVKKIKQEVRDDPEDWQSNLDNWKSSRRKRQEHIIERVVEVKKLELEEHDRQRRRSKTFSEMMEERGSRGRKLSMSLAMYHEEDANDLSDLGIGTSSGKSSVSGDTHDDMQSVLSDRDSEIEKNHSDLETGGANENENENANANANENNNPQESNETPTTETSSRTIMSAPSVAKKPSVFGNGFHNDNDNRPYNEPIIAAAVSSPEPEEYTYEGAIRGYVSRVTQNIPRRSLVNLDAKLDNANSNDNNEDTNNDEKSIGVPLVKVDVLKRREIFEKASQNKTDNRANNINNNSSARSSGDLSNTKTIKERLSSLEKQNRDTESADKETKAIKRLSGDMSLIRERFSHLEKQTSERENKVLHRDTSDLEHVRRLSNIEKYTNSNTDSTSGSSKIGAVGDNAHFAQNGEGIAAKIVKDRFVRLDTTGKSKESVVNKKAPLEKQPMRFINEENSTPSERSLSPDSEYRVPRAAFHRSLDSLDADASSGPDTFERVQSLEELDYSNRYPPSSSSTEVLNDTDREDSGIHTADVSCSVSQADEPVDEEIVHQPETILERPETALEKNEMSSAKETNLQEKSDQTKSSEVAELYIAVKAVEGPQQATAAAAVTTKESIVVDSTDVETRVRDEKSQSDEYEAPRSDGPTMDLPSFDDSVAEQQQHRQISESQREPEIVRPVPLPLQSSPFTTGTLIFDESSIFGTLSPSSKQFSQMNITSDEEFVNGLNFPLGPSTNVEPPKEKPPPPPTDLSDEESLPVEPLKRLNSTRRIKKELRTRRSDFLGIEGINDDDLEREVRLTKPPDMAMILAAERRIEQQDRRSYDTDSNYEQDSSHERDSGVELGHTEDWSKQPVSPDMSQHSRQSSEPFGASVTSSEEDEITKKEREIIEVLEKEEQWRYGNDREQNSDIGEKLAHKLRELEEEKMQLERDRAQETELRRHEETLRKNDENERKKEEETLRKQQQEIIRQQREAERVAETAKRAEEKKLREDELMRIKTEQLRIQGDHEEKERRTTEVRRQENALNRSMGVHIRAHDAEQMAINSKHDDDYSSGEVLRVERELLQLEQEELKRRRTNMAYREQRQLQLAEQLQEQWQSLQDVANVSNASNRGAASPRYKYQSAPVNYRSSMPNLQLHEGQKRRPPPPPIPPSKPSRLVEQMQRDVTIRNSRIPSADSIPQQVEDAVGRSNSSTTLSNHTGQQMTKETLHALSAVPRPRIVKGDQWVQRRKSDVPRGTQEYNYQHWLIQEAEQRRINEKNQRSVGRKPQQHITGTSIPYAASSASRSDCKPLPDSIIQTLTQRVQNRVQERPPPPRRRLEQSTSHEHLSSIHQQSPQHVAMLQHPKVHQYSAGNNADTQEKMLSVSGKKKCSHCGDELGRGAAMIIESLRLFYHMECFKCCVCHVRLGDGLMGTDVRVRNHKLHCHNCYSSDDGVKFSCV